MLRGPGVLEAGAEEIEVEDRRGRKVRKALQTALKGFRPDARAGGQGARRRSAQARDWRSRSRSPRDRRQLAPQVSAHHRSALLDRIAKAGLDIAPSDERLLKEAIFFADRSDISEELTRLRSHLDQFLSPLHRKREPVGRTLDFLLQELFREINTIGNKANFLAISQIVVVVKTELEKLREQVQNIE